MANSYLSQFHEVHYEDVFIENGANELSDNIIDDSEVHNGDVIIEESANESHATLLTILGLSTSTEVSVKTVAQVKMRILNKLILHAKINQKKISRMTQNMNTCATI